MKNENFVGTGRGFFGEWLANRMRQYRVYTKEMASDLHTSRRTIQRHIWQESKPSYADITMYAVYFHCLSYRDTLWHMVQKDWEDEE